MKNTTMNTSQLMQEVKKENVKVFTTWKTNGDFLTMSANKEELLSNLEQQLKMNGEQDFGMVVKELQTEVFGTTWTEGFELYLL